MNDLVFLEPDKIDAVPFTTSDVIAEYAQVDSKSVDRLIRNYSTTLEKFGLLAFEIRAVKMTRGIKYIKTYHLNEEQATLLITFLKNTEPVIKFKTELVRQFYRMRAELQKRQMLRTQLKPVRRELTDAIRDNPDHAPWEYKNYTDLAYIFVTGKCAKQLRKERNAGKTASAIDYMTSDEIERITKTEYQISVLYELGMNYQQIKETLFNRKLKSIAS